MDIGENAGVIEFPKGKLVALATDCNSIWTALEPYSGAANSACEALSNVVSVGGKPVLLADCLNFGNPEKPESYAQLVESIRGIGQFSRDLDIPVVAGSGSLYNEKELDGAVQRINPTPQVMIAGLIPEGQPPIRRGLCTPLANIYLIGDTHQELNGTEYQLNRLGTVSGLPPAYRPIYERNAMKALHEARSKGIIRSCNNVGRGGLAIALMKMVMSSNYGFRVEIDKVPGTVQTQEGILFSETTGRYLAEVTETNQEEFVSIMSSHNVRAVELGLTTFEQVANFGSFKLNIETTRKSYAEVLSGHMQNVSR
jgi:phosphoribosylformylglycinamidine synthase